jgi:PRTRC genetic system protein F
MYEFSCWYWDGNESITDGEATELMKDRFDDPEALKRFLPSSVRPVIHPDDMSPEFRVVKRRATCRTYLSPADLRVLRNRLTGLSRRVCTALLELHALMSAHRKREVLHMKYSTNPVYAPCTLVYQWNGWTEELLDVHYDNAGNSGDGTTYLGFSPLASTSQAIRTQYADWSHALPSTDLDKHEFNRDWPHGGRYCIALRNAALRQRGRHREVCDSPSGRC